MTPTFPIRMTETWKETIYVRHKEKENWNSYREIPCLIVSACTSDCVPFPLSRHWNSYIKCYPFCWCPRKSPEFRSDRNTFSFSKCPCKWPNLWHYLCPNSDVGVYSGQTPFVRQKSSKNMSWSFCKQSLCFHDMKIGGQIKRMSWNWAVKTYFLKSEWEDEGVGMPQCQNGNLYVNLKEWKKIVIFSVDYNFLNW